jgi:hypothetical protein
MPLHLINGLPLEELAIDMPPWSSYTTSNTCE